jgi:hypothetical protein
MKISLHVVHELTTVKRVAQNFTSLTNKISIFSLADSLIQVLLRHCLKTNNLKDKQSQSPPNQPTASLAESKSQQLL